MPESRRAVIPSGNAGIDRIPGISDPESTFVLYSDPTDTIHQIVKFVKRGFMSIDVFICIPTSRVEKKVLETSKCLNPL